MVVEAQEREELGGRQNEELAGQPELEMEQLFPQSLCPQQPRKQERQPELPLNKEEQKTPRNKGEQEMRLEPVQQIAALNQHGTRRQWLRWLGEQVSDLADRMDEEQR